MTGRGTDLDLCTPSRSRPGPGAFDVAPRRVRSWVESLPLANGPESARLLLAALREVNCLAVPPAQRYRFLEILRAPVGQLSAGLERHFMGKSFPLSSREQRLAGLCQEFQSLMAQGYEVLLEDLIGGPAPVLVLRRGMVAVAIHRAVSYLSRTLLKSYQLYAPYPDNVWRDIHQLYRFAVWTRIQDREVLDDQNRLVQTTSISRAYKQILLLAICSPYRLRQGDVVKVYSALERWAAHCRLNRIGSRAQTWQGLFGVPADIDDQPKYLDLTRRGHTGGLEWVLDTTGLGRVLRDQLESLSDSQARGTKASGEIPPDISPQLLQRVMQSWGMMQNREHSRVEKAGSIAVEVALGLSAIHAVIGGHGPPEEENQTGAEETGTEETALSVAHSPFPWASSDRSKVRHETVKCGVGDEGAGGYRLLWPGGSSVKAHVGALLGMRRVEDGEDAAQWRIGVVRWMRAAEDGSLEVGVQMVAPFSQAIRVRACNEHGHCGEPIDSLLLPPVAAASRREIIIGPVFLDNFGKGLVVRASGEERMVRFTRVLENTGSFAQFEFESLAEKGDAGDLKRRAEDGESESEQDFDSLWSSM